MKLIAAFFRLVRWPNLVFIALTQMLFYYCIIVPVLPPSYYSLPHHITIKIFYLTMAASVLIAAGGYIINDYFDVNIDQVNKPEKVVVEKIINRRWAIFLHLILTTAGVIISFYVAAHSNKLIFLLNVVCTLLLWLYSTTFKKKLLSGNIIISLLTAWTILVLYFAVNITNLITISYASEIEAAVRRLFKYAILYAGFAFIISLVREVIKDIEDVQGDERYNCTTMPIVWGIPASKVFAAVWIIVLISALAIVQFYVLQLGWWLSALYCFVLIIVPLVWVLKKLYEAQESKQYHQLSSAIKLVMLSGILSMIFLWMYS
ncbi:geranylgeranylglycerol-phosphate geranylgeranyltransferase [Ferruginibacter albus]|uniref:geranylgeranylglycerol-phosphate geranylgeranyltransferase n=1 Tax=Ferruginibacter albus TaxID=2875540 RepID=UPI001CC540D6|nr:geranylgeranylglycerol-phosphate geranylgeranyltransferase [Ferruginibacter albus]UAY50763.1 geranylgeranylglycerol-phosphate geranylgeranyltransferase [Ferruginibacter albus]